MPPPGSPAGSRKALGQVCPLRGAMRDEARRSAIPSGTLSAVTPRPSLWLVWKAARSPSGSRKTPGQVCPLRGAKRDEARSCQGQGVPHVFRPARLAARQRPVDEVLLHTAPLHLVHQAADVLRQRAVFLGRLKLITKLHKRRF